MRGLALRETPLLKRGWARQPGVNQFAHGGEGYHALLRHRRMRLISRSGGGDVEHSDARVRDAGLLCGGEGGWEGGEACQERFRA